MVYLTFRILIIFGTISCYLILAVMQGLFISIWFNEELSSSCGSWNWACIRISCGNWSPSCPWFCAFLHFLAVQPILKWDVQKADNFCIPTFFALLDVLSSQLLNMSCFLKIHAQMSSCRSLAAFLTLISCFLNQCHAQNLFEVHLNFFLSKFFSAGKDDFGSPVWWTQGSENKYVHGTLLFLMC